MSFLVSLIFVNWNANRLLAAAHQILSFTFCMHLHYYGIDTCCIHALHTLYVGECNSVIWNACETRDAISWNGIAICEHIVHVQMCMFRPIESVAYTNYYSNLMYWRMYGISAEINHNICGGTNIGWPVCGSQGNGTIQILAFRIYYNNTSTHLVNK